jgi:GcrA cell cycle regulator
MTARNIPWPPERLERLRELWAQRMTAEKIGHALGITKNAVIGKANRLGLDPRVVRVAPARPAIDWFGSDECAWPIGYPGEPDFRFCREKREAGMSYCPAHRRRAYAKPPREDGDAAA